MRTRFFAELYRRDPLLTLVGWLHILALLAAFVGYWSDDRLVMGINTWIKPMKCMISAAVLLWTIAWFSRYIRRPRWALKTVGIVVAASVIIESTCILWQAARGARSHFNVGTDFDVAIYQTIVTMTFIQWLSIAAVLFLFGKPAVRLRLPPVYLWGIRTGLVLFLVGGVIEGIMIVHGGYTVGMPDGGPGVPILNWSTVAGDLRVAHGLAVHALQILPLAAFGLGRWHKAQGKMPGLTLLALGAGLYAALVYAALRQALAGSPVV